MPALLLFMPFQADRPKNSCSYFSGGLRSLAELAH